MAHKIILRQMEAMGQAAGRAMQGDPMQGYLANLDQEDYKRFFRPILPEYLTGRRFLDEYGPTVDSETTVDPDVSYPIQGAADHHIMEPRRVTDFVQHLTEATEQPAGTRDQGICLDKAGHLMYASHRSYQHHALLSTPEADLLVQLVRKHEPAGLYGARITDAGGGGTVAVLADQSPRAQGAIEAILKEYEQQTGRHAELLNGSSEGAWHAGTRLAGQTE
jgi:galactokinase